MLLSLEEFISGLASTEGSLSAVENHIVVADCLTALRYMPECSVDVVHTSPPYNIDKAYKGNHGDRKALDTYLAFLRAVIVELKRVLKPHGSLFWQTGYTQLENGLPGDILPIDIVTYQFFREEPNALVLWDRIIWRYFGGLAFKKKFTNRHETILWYVKPLAGVANPHFDVDVIRERSRELDKRNNLWGRNPGNVWEVDRVAYGSTEQSSHIAVYPEEIAEKIIRACSRPGELVLDPFSGSGTTPKVARSLGRRWIGIEISPDYARESVKRLGFQQPSEAASLASALTKVKAFGGRRQTLPLEEVARRLRAWARSVDVEGARGTLDKALARVLQRQNGKDSKPEVWEFFERLFRVETTHPVVEADALLTADYKQRRNQNEVFRYRTALEILEGLVNRIQESPNPELISFVRDIAADEPSSYRLSEINLTLLRVQKRIRAPHEDDGVEPSRPEVFSTGELDAVPSAPVGESSDKTVYQPKLPLRSH